MENAEEEPVQMSRLDTRMKMVIADLFSTEALRCEGLSRMEIRIEVETVINGNVYRQDFCASQEYES